jgi:hypothetical protein
LGKVGAGARGLALAHEFAELWDYGVGDGVEDFETFFAATSEASF